MYAILLLCWSTACFITLFSFTQPFYIGELYSILTHCWGIPCPFTLLINSQKLILCWATPNPNTLLRYSLSQQIAEQFPISIHTELYPILTHCWGIPYLITSLSNSQVLIHCWATSNPNILLRYTQLLLYIAEVNPNSLHDRVIPNSNTSLR